MGPPFRRALAVAACFALGACTACTRRETPLPTTTSPTTPVVASVPPPPILKAMSSAAPATLAASSGPTSTVRLVGRFDTSAPPGIRFAWSGSALVAKFSGTALRMRMKDENKYAFNAFQVVVDGEPKGVLKMKKNEELYTVVDGLPDGVHEVALHRRTEAKVGETIFLGFEPVGRMLAAPPPPERRVEVLGDSISTGWGNEGPNATCGYHPDQQNEFATYGAIAARELKADHTTIAWSGKTIGEMTSFFERTLPERDDSRWDFRTPPPQLVVVNLGTNNFAVTDPGEKRFVEVYTKLFARLRSAYPDAYVVCALGPMLTNIYPEGRNNLTQARKYMKAAVAKIKEGGETKMDFLEFPEQNHADGLGCGFHPSLKTHRLMAERLVALARERLGW